MELSQTIALISGGASGLGASAARGLTTAGACVLILDQDGARAAALAEELGDRARWAAADVTDEASVQAAIERARTEFGGLNALINTVGIGMALRTTSKNGPHPLDVFEEVVRINLVGAFNVLRLCATAMVSNAPDANGERGVILNALDAAAFDGQTGQAAYAASKGGLAALTLPIARDLAGDGIRVCGIVPPGAENAGVSRHSRGDEFTRIVLYALMTPGLTGEIVRAAPQSG
jgi:3-hydroxyacyl-CoA dehydrogenase / 3-hydroxy-2-methylbutyryl-CoA dehydrogenase